MGLEQAFKGIFCANTMKSHLFNLSVDRFPCSLRYKCDFWSISYRRSPYNRASSASISERLLRSFSEYIPSQRLHPVRMGYQLVGTQSCLTAYSFKLARNRNNPERLAWQKSKLASKDSSATSHLILLGLQTDNITNDFHPRVLHVDLSV